MDNSTDGAGSASASAPALDTMSPPVPVDSVVRRWWRPWLFSLLLWSAVAFVLAAYRLAVPGDRPTAEAFGRALRREVAFWVSWAPLTPGMLLLSARVASDKARRRHLLFTVVGAGILAVLSHTFLSVTMARLFQVARPNVTTADAVRQMLRAAWYWEAIVYASVMGISIASQYRRHLQVREREAVDLRGQLVEAQLAALRMQLQPHFLFNTLHAISVLVTHNPEQATAVIARLGDLLRATLDETQRQEVPLRTELELLEMYLDIERIRFGNRLSIEISAAPDTLACPVPTFILQPLVENAIRHGIEARVGSGWIRVRAERRDGWLCLEVADNGEGLLREAERNGRQGIGVANTRQRLAKLYGPRHAFSLERAAEGETVARVEIPDTDRGADRAKSVEPS